MKASYQITPSLVITAMTQQVQLFHFYHTVTFYYGCLVIWMLSIVSHLHMQQRDIGLWSWVQPPKNIQKCPPFLLPYAKYQFIGLKKSCQETMQIHVGKLYPCMLSKDTDWLQIAPMISFLVELLLPMCHCPSPCPCPAPLTWRHRLVSSDAEHSRHSDEREQLW